MAKINTNAQTSDNKTAYWQGEIERSLKRYRSFHSDGEDTVDAYRLQKGDGANALNKDKYNILYSSTETIRPNLYAQTPKPRCTLRNKDLATDLARFAARLMEGCLTYLQSEEDFDDLMAGAVEDYLLPGLGTAFVRYEATFQDSTDDSGNPIPVPGGKKGENQQELLDEMVKMDYVFWKDFLTGVARRWNQVPWVAKRLWLTKDDAMARFGTDKANELTYATRDGNGRENNPSETAEVWEIWDKTTKTVYWYAEGQQSLLDEKSDPLKLKNFFPCPRPMRAISNTREMVPRSFYTQYKSQADTLNIMTKRIRLLSEALRVIGLYDGSQIKLADLLNPAAGNRMVAVDNWAVFAQNGGILGQVQWLPIDAVVKVLTELLQAREVAKAEIYEITGLSDIQRGVTKASETLGAQNIKAQWAGARATQMQNEVQRFARDLLALAGEVTVEHCSPMSIAIFSGIPIPDPQAVQQNPQLQQQVQLFKQACDFLKNEIRRVAAIDIETDSTLMANEAQERDDRTKFLAAAGAFLQQSVPAMEATPELGPLLGAMLMFVVRTFPSSRDVEDEFEKVQKVMEQAAGQPQNQDKDGKKAAIQQQAQAAQMDAQIKQQELQIRQQNEQAKSQQDAQTENNRHQEKMLDLQLRQQEIQIKMRELAFKESSLAIEQQNADTARFAAEATAAAAAATAGIDADESMREENLAYAQMKQDDEHHDDEQATARASAQAAAEVKTALPTPGGANGTGSS